MDLSDYNNSFAARMIRRAQNQKSRNTTINDNTNEYVKSKYSNHCPIDDKSGQRGAKNNGNCVVLRWREAGTSTATTTPPLESNVRIKTQPEGNNDSTITSLSAKINDLDAQIADLGIQETLPISIHPDRSAKIYPTLIDIKHPTPNPHPNSDSTDKKSTVILDNNGNIIADNFKTPMKPPRCKPNLESTRKGSPKSGPSSKIDSPNTECTISTIQLVDSPLSSAPPRDEDQEENKTYVEVGSPILPDEIEHFLENALGDEFYNSSVTYALGIDNSNVNASDLMSQTPSKSFIRRVKSFFSRQRSTSKSNSQSMTSPKNFRSFNKADKNAKLYRSLSSRVKKKLRGSFIREEPENPVVLLPDYLQLPKESINSQKIEKLLQEVRIQTTILNQASKALEMCQMKKEFNASQEEIESQRWLLLADIRKRLLLQELKDLSGISEDLQLLDKTEDSSVQCGTVSIKEIKLTLRECLYRESEPGEIQEWFVIVITEGTNVYASSAVPCPVESFIMSFPGFSCVMNDLSPNLKILLEVYVLKLTTGIRYQHELKYHIEHDEKNTSCPSPGKLLKRVERPLSPKTRRPVFLTSSFTACGNVELSLRDLTISTPWPLAGVPRDSILLGTIDLNLTCSLNFSVDHKGFVNYLDEYDGLTYWTRRWCVIQGSHILFWNYPEDQEDKPPVVTIDLHCCASDKINHVTRSMCARPRTLLIETLRQSEVDDKTSLLVECHSGFTLIKHLLSYETTRELVDVMDKMNYVLGILRKWKVTTTIRPPKPPGSQEMVSEL